MQIFLDFLFVLLWTTRKIWIRKNRGVITTALFQKHFVALQENLGETSVYLFSKKSSKEKSKTRLTTGLLICTLKNVRFLFIWTL